ncbi:helicase, partial [Gorgonomyces haynaldii]
MSKRKQDQTFYKVLWRKKQFKTHKTWDGDGYLSSGGGQLVLYDEQGTVLAKSQAELVGDELSMGGRDILVECEQEPQFQSPKPVDKENKPPKVLKPVLKPSGSLRIQKVVKKSVQPRFDPTKPNALVMDSPADSKMPVVVDPLISQHLRPHQREGVKFLYNCVMGLDPEIQGAILADAMGLGKTIQTIALVWTLLKQSPYSGPACKRVLIVCPASLLQNWKNEFKKWLGDYRIHVYVTDPSQKTIRDFTNGRLNQVLIIGYEKMRSLEQEIAKSQFDMIVCDEGHRLKNNDLKAFSILSNLKAKKRIILSGTPIQNDLSEFYNMADFVNPGLFGTLANFKREFMNPISQATTQSDHLTLKRAQEANERLNDLTKRFVLRRTSELNAQYLPPKQELVFFCKMTRHQESVYEAQLEKMQDSGVTFADLHVLRQCANVSSLVDPKQKEESGKMNLLAKLLKWIHSKKEKVVLVSHWTSVLDLMEKRFSQYRSLRLDGSTPSTKRQQLVDQFSDPNVFIFYLSAKAGGVGLNLVAGNHLISCDIDWNPSVDQQAMARIWRDGQQKPVTIYRLLTTGTIEERIYQRQLVKLELSGNVLDDADLSQAFTKEELKELLAYDNQLKECLTIYSVPDRDPDVHLSPPFEKLDKDLSQVLSGVSFCFR